MEKINLHKYKVPLICTVLVIAAFGAGAYVGNSHREQTPGWQTSPNPMWATSTVDMNAFWDVWNLLNQKFVQTHKNVKVATDQDKVYAAIQGLTTAYGDPYTVFMPPVEASSFNQNITGDFGGVGMELGEKNNVLTVIAPLKGTPAYNAGVKSGDVVLSVDGTSTINMDVDTAVNLIRGAVGTPVTIVFARDGVKDPITLKIVRATIEEPTVDTETKGDAFVIHLYIFNAVSIDQFRTALRSFVQSGKSHLILDLRGNPGGYLDAAVDMASYFLPLGKTVVTEDYGSSTPPTVYRSKGYDVFDSRLRMAILVDSGSASASEILSGALQEYGIAKLVGTKTFGKGSVQELIPITSDTSLKVTVARWLTPDGISISDGGLTPDYFATTTDADIAAGNDPQMTKAIQVLDQE